MEVAQPLDPLAGNLLQGAFGLTIDHVWFRLAGTTRQQLRWLQAIFDGFPQRRMFRGPVTQWYRGRANAGS